MIYFITIIALIGIDQLTKIWAVDALMHKGPQGFIDGFLGFRYVENTGAAFSILKDQQLLLILITFVILAGMIGYMIKAIKTEAPIVVKLAYISIISGAVGNFIDRARLNYVIDFLEFKFIRFPVFNVADVLVVVGVILLSYAILFMKYDF